MSESCAVPIKNVTLATVRRGAVAAFSPGVGLQEHIKPEPVFFHFTLRYAEKSYAKTW